MKSIIVLAVFFGATFWMLISEYNAAKKISREIELSDKTPEELLAELNRDFNDPKILWP